MIPAAFAYARPQSLPEAIELLGGEGAAALAGGQSLLPLLRLRLAQPALLVDLQDVPGLTGIGLHGVQGERVRIGSMTRHAGLAAEAPFAALREAAALTGDRQVRRLGTIGGSICHADPAGDLSAALLALGAQVELKGPRGRRTLPVRDFLVGPLLTDRQPQEIVTSLEIEVPALTFGSAYRKLRQAASGFALAGVAAALAFDAAGVCRRAGIGVTGVGPAPYACAAAAAALVGTRVGPDDVDRAVAGLTEGVDVADDAYAGGDYRRHICGVLGREAIAAAASRALEAPADI